MRKDDEVQYDRDAVLRWGEKLREDVAICKRSSVEVGRANEIFWVEVYRIYDIYVIYDRREKKGNERLEQMRENLGDPVLWYRER
jgi:hypothetical protein